MKICKNCHGLFIPKYNDMRMKTCSKFCFIENCKKRRHTQKTKNKISSIQLGLIGPKARAWKGGRWAKGRDYVALYSGPYSNKKILEHRIIMEAYLGRKLRKDEIIHHRNENKQDNRIENLEVLTRSNHSKIHHLGGDWRKKCA